MYFRRGRFSFFLGKVPSLGQWRVWLRMRGHDGMPRWFASVGAEVVALLVLLAPSLAHAAEEMAGQGWDVFATVYVVGFAWLAGLAAWGVAKLVGFLDAAADKARAEGKTIVWQGFVSRLVGRVHVGAEKIGAEWKRLMEEAQRPDSPGGRRITKAELDEARQKLKTFVIDGWGSWDALLREGTEILGGSVEEFVDGVIDAELSKQANPPTPAS